MAFVGDDAVSAKYLHRAVQGLGARLGRDVHEATLCAFAAAQPPFDESVIVRRDLAYGEHPRQRLTIFAHGVTGEASAPVLLFVHGGGFVQGDTVIPGTCFFDNIGYFAARMGMIGVNVAYRLAPEHCWPAAGEDLAAAIAWLHRELPSLGGEPARIVAMGSSAGAMAVMDVLDRPRQGREYPIAAAILRSGVYDLAALPGGSLKAALLSYYGGNAREWPARLDPAVLAHVPVPMLMTLAQYDPPELHAQALGGLRHFLKGHAMRRFELLEHHNHYSIDLASGSAASEGDRAVVGFLRDLSILPAGSRTL